jgi:hypothetical protein
MNTRTSILSFYQAKKMYVRCTRCRKNESKIPFNPVINLNNERRSLGVRRDIPRSRSSRSSRARFILVCLVTASDLPRIQAVFSIERPTVKAEWSLARRSSRPRASPRRDIVAAQGLSMRIIRARVGRAREMLVVPEACSWSESTFPSVRSVFMALRCASR